MYHWVGERVLISINPGKIGVDAQSHVDVRKNGVTIEGDAANLPKDNSVLYMSARTRKQYYKLQKKDAVVPSTSQILQESRCRSKSDHGPVWGNVSYHPHTPMWRKEMVGSRQQRSDSLWTIQSQITICSMQIPRWQQGNKWSFDRINRWLFGQDAPKVLELINTWCNLSFSVLWLCEYIAGRFQLLSTFSSWLVWPTYLSAHFC